MEVPKPTDIIFQGFINVSNYNKTGWSLENNSISLLTQRLKRDAFKIQVLYSYHKTFENVGIDQSKVVYYNVKVKFFNCKCYQRFHLPLYFEIFSQIAGCFQLLCENICCQCQGSKFSIQYQDKHGQGNISPSSTASRTK